MKKKNSEPFHCLQTLFKNQNSSLEKFHWPRENFRKKSNIEKLLKFAI